MVQKLCYAPKSVTDGHTDGRTDGRMHARTNVPEAICPSNFFEVGGIIRKKNNDKTNAKYKQQTHKKCNSGTAMKRSVEKKTTVDSRYLDLAYLE